MNWKLLADVAWKLHTRGVIYTDTPGAYEFVRSYPRFVTWDEENEWWAMTESFDEMRELANRLSSIATPG